MFRDSGRYSEDGDDEPEAMSDTNDTVENSDPQTKQVTTLMALEDGTGGTLMPTRTGEADIEAELQAECGWYGIEYPTASQSELVDLAGRDMKRGAAARKRRHNSLTKSFRAAAAKRSSTRQDQQAIRLAQAAASITAFTMSRTCVTVRADPSGWQNSGRSSPIPCALRSSSHASISATASK